MSGRNGSSWREERARRKSRRRFVGRDQRAVWRIRRDWVINKQPGHPIPPQQNERAHKNRRTGGNNHSGYRYQCDGCREFFKHGEPRVRTVTARGLFDGRKYHPNHVPDGAKSV